MFIISIKGMEKYSEMNEYDESYMICLINILKNIYEDNDVYSRINTIINKDLTYDVRKNSYYELRKLLLKKEDISDRIKKILDLILFESELILLNLIVKIKDIDKKEFLNMVRFLLDKCVNSSNKITIFDEIIKNHIIFLDPIIKNEFYNIIDDIFYGKLGNYNYFNKIILFSQIVQNNYFFSDFIKTRLPNIMKFLLNENVNIDNFLHKMDLFKNIIEYIDSNNVFFKDIRNQDISNTFLEFVKIDLLNIIKKKNLFFNKELFNLINSDQKSLLLKELKSIYVIIEDYQKQEKYNDIKDKLLRIKEETKFKINEIQ